jgi:hypothetical protein
MGGVDWLRQRLSWGLRHNPALGTPRRLQYESEVVLQACNRLDQLGRASESGEKKIFYYLFQ